jgi:large subunit ribosomal protein L17
MRHQKANNHLGRTRSHRKAMLSNMAASLILHKRIKTTTAKAKALRAYVEPLITKSKEDTTHSRREVFSRLQDKVAVAELFREVSPKIGERPGGYTRILKTGNRLGDNAELCIIELVDYNEGMLKEKVAKAKTTRRRRGGKKKEEAKEDVAAAVEVDKSGGDAQQEVNTEEPDTSETEKESKEELPEVPEVKGEDKPEETKEDKEEDNDEKGTEKSEKP